ncbi:MAG: type Z 30S ribosomal protein S14 [Bdellovibrionaceae bacterium]|nr:type Z 30S ribosomal protein S14 [Pseudobdellovibrionaceae bacterium]
MARLAMVVKSERKPRFKVRAKSRCKLCGRSKAYLRKFQICRLCFRSLANKGMIPGVTKASW